MATKSLGGRPKIEIDPKRVQDYASLGAKNNEIATMLECSTDTLERRFAAELAKGRASLKFSLRRWQLENAKNGNATMQIWLGKQYLEQTDKVEIEQEIEVNTNFKKYEKDKP